MYLSALCKSCLNKTGVFTKTVRIMQLITIFILAAFLQVSAAGYSQKVTLNKNNIPLQKVFEEIRKQTGYDFFYADEVLQASRNVSVNVKKGSIEEVLDLCFQNQQLAYTILEKTIIIKRRAIETTMAAPPPQVIEFKGRVTDEKGQPLEGASVVIKTTGAGTKTDATGYFAIKAEKNTVLEISYIGKTSQIVKLTDNSIEYKVILAEAVIQMQEVVVTALGIRREEKALGYAVQSVSGNTLQTVKGIDVGTSLTGKVAGLLVKNSTEFTEAPDVQIRGENPLLVVDGVPYGNMTLRDIPSDDIESISILKGATASALYGVRGQSGALMITTKKGTAKKGMSVSFNSGTMLTAGYLAIPELQATYGRVINTATNTVSSSGDGSWGAPLDGRMVKQWDPISKTMITAPYLPIGKDNFRNFIEQGYILNNNISLVQQGEFGSFRSSVTWVKNRGQYPNSMFDKLTYSIGGDMKFNNFTLSSSITYNKQSSPQTGFNGYTAYDPMYNLLVWSAPDFDVRNMRDYWIIKNETQNTSYTNTNNNPYFDRYERLHSLNRDIFNGTVALNYNFTPWLKATFRTGYDTYSDRQTVRISKGSLQSGGASNVLKGGSQVWGESAKGSYNEGIGRGYSTNNDLILTGNKTFGNFTVDALVGGTIFYKKDEGLEAFTQGGLLVPGYYSLKASTTPAYVNSTINTLQINSLYARVSVGWKRLLYADGTFRNDWSSTLPKATRSYSYPSVSGSFIASEILPKTDWLSLWKFRGSWTTARKIPNPFEINSVYNIANNTWGTLSAAALSTTIRSSDVRSEGSTTYEIGTAINVLKNRAFLDITYYSKRMYDGLVYAGSTPSSGYSNTYVNTGEQITRRGVEISAGGTPVKKGDWRWDVAVNWSTYARYYSKLDPVYSLNKPWVAVGERADAYVIRDYLKDPQGNIIHNNGLPLYSGFDTRYGYADPKFVWGANTTLTYKNWQFGVSIDGRVGGLTQTITEMYMWRAGSHPLSLVPERMLDATNPGTKNYTGPGVKVVSGAASFDAFGNIISDTRVFAQNDVKVTYESYTNNLHKGTAWGGAPSSLEVYSTTFFKIREMSVTYNLPKSLLNKIHANAVSISAVGQNLFLKAKQFRYSDPDSGSDNFSDPSQRYIGVNIKLTF